MNWFSFHPGDFAVSFLSVLLEGIPFLLLGSILSGLVEAFVSAEKVARMLPRNPFLAVCTSGLLGLIFPMCECGSVVVIRRFIRKGLPLGSALTYMLAAPIVSPIVALGTFAAFRGQHAGEMTVLRLTLGLLLGIAAGWIAQRFPASALLQPGVGPDVDPPSSRSTMRVAADPDSPTSSESNSPALRAVYTAATDFLDVAVFFVIGAAVTSLLGTSIDRTVLEPIAGNPPVAIFGLMGLAAALALCSTTDAFIAATSFQAFPMTAKLAFLLFGPMFDLKLYWLYGLIFKRRFVISLAFLLFVIVGLVCWRLTGIVFIN
jgi:uncharacterized membrane protein YraQ (UPF0718 family)